MSAPTSQDGKPIRGSIHSIGDAEIRQSIQSDIAVFSVSGPYSGTLMEALEEQICKTRGNIGLDLGLAVTHECRRFR